MGIVFDKVLGEALLHNHIKVSNTEPSTAVNGDMYINSFTNTLNLYYSEEWRILHTFTVGPYFLLQENGDFIFQENNDKIIIRG